MPRVSNSLAEFDRAMKRRGIEVEKGAAKLIRRIGVAVGVTAILNTQRKTGRAQLNWQASRRTPKTDFLQPKQGPAASTSVALRRVRRVSEAYQSSKGGDLIFQNNARYAVGLDARAHFVRKAIEQGLLISKASRLFPSGS